MHNVRNSLSPVQVILATLERRLASALPVEATRALAELADRHRARTAAADRLSRRGASGLRQWADRAMPEAGSRRPPPAAALDAIRESHADPGEIDHRQRCDLAELLELAVSRGASSVMPKSGRAGLPGARLAVRGNRCCWRRFPRKPRHQCH